jgi:Putative lumazine-binding
MSTTARDYDEIVRVVQLYVDAISNREGGPVDGPDPVRVDMLREAFHEDAWIFFTEADGTLRRNLISDDFAGWAGVRPNDGRRVTGRIISVTQAGDVASVLLGYDHVLGEAHSWVDFHTLLRINGVWKITNKTATHATRASWAADRNVQDRQATVA